MDMQLCWVAESHCAMKRSQGVAQLSLQRPIAPATLQERARAKRKADSLTVHLRAEHSAINARCDHAVQRLAFAVEAADRR